MCRFSSWTRPALNRTYLDRFNQDYLPGERESDQKLLTTLGLIGPNDTVAQILLSVLQEQILGLYNQDDKTMYLLADRAQFGPAEKDTFAREYDHALQDQYYDLSTLVPRHADNDDRSLAMQALIQGDATLMQRLWAQQNLSSDELAQLGRGGSTSKLFSAPLFLREQLLFPYADGYTFVKQIYQTSGYAGVDDVFRDPPQSTAQVLHLDKYRNRAAPVAVELPDLSQGVLGDGWRQINSNVFGELDLRLILTQLTDSTSGVRGASGWSGDRWALLEKDGRQALVIKSVWDSDAEASTFFKTCGAGDAESLLRRDGERGDRYARGADDISCRDRSPQKRRHGRGRDLVRPLECRSNRGRRLARPVGLAFGMRADLVTNVE